MADLHRPATLGFARARELDARERGPVDAVAAGATAGDHHQVARLDRALRATARHDADSAAEHERIADVARVEGDGTGDRGDAHPVAVVANARGHAGEQPPGVDHARRDLGGRRVGRRHAEHVEVCDRLGAQARAEHVADHAPQPRGGAAVGLDGRGMVVRLHLHADVVIAVEPHHARVVTKHAHAPVAGSELLPDRSRGGEHRFLEQVVVSRLARWPRVVDGAGERLVAAVLAPGLGDRLQFDLEGVAARRGEVVADAVQLADRQRQAPRAAQLLQSVVVESGQPNRLLREGPGAATGE